MGCARARAVQALKIFEALDPGAGLEPDPHNDGPPRTTVEASACPSKALGTQARRRGRCLKALCFV
jgi:hypothetical protein